ALHEKGIYHRDIKPSNIIICENKPVLIDFSISTFDNATALTQIGSVIGTPQYLSPEAHLQNSSFDTSASSDWWGFSATLCFALTGKPPFGEAAATLSNINAGNIDLQGLGASVRQILSVALDPDIKNRASAWETLDELANNVKKHRFRDRMFIWLNKN
ncbi:MAG: protein kinase, partial [Bifidobacteriaceae bacterium]|nr:protein kinase [Bifidobacteriaceae bacterium]